MARPFLRTAACASALVVTLSIAGCGGTTTPDTPADLDPDALGGEAITAQMQELYTAALDGDETEIVVQGPAAAETAPVWEAFEARFPGIKVVAQSVAPPETEEKLKAEASSGNHVIDLVATGDTPAAALSSADLCQAVDAFAAEGIDDRWIAMNGTVLIPSISIFGTVYNPDLVDAADVPQSWEELLEPQWKGKIATGDPAGGGIAGYAFAEMLFPENAERLGMSYVEKLKAQDLQIVSSEPEIASAVASGRFPIGILVWKGFADEVVAKGVPLEFAFPMAADNITTSDAYCVAKTAPHANAAALLANWLFTPDAQQITADIGSYSTMPGAPAPGGLPALDAVSILPTPPIEEVDEAIAPLRDEIIALFS